MYHYCYFCDMLDGISLILVDGEWVYICWACEEELA